jgi:hypothetical protein
MEKERRGFIIGNVIEIVLGLVLVRVMEDSSIKGSIIIREKKKGRESSRVRDILKGIIRRRIKRKGEG